jgi:hypothetical protein
LRRRSSGNGDGTLYFAPFLVGQSERRGAGDTLPNLKQAKKIVEEMAALAERLRCLHPGSAEPPREWLPALKKYAAHQSHLLREASLQSIPRPMPTECFEVVAQTLEDRDLGVCLAACEIAVESGRSE